MTADVKLAQARELFLQGNTHFENGRLEQARSCYENALALAPGRPSVLANLGITQFHLRQWHDAVPLLREATVADPAQSDAWIYLGLCHQALEQWQAAIDSLSQALELEPGRAGLWLACGQCQLRLGLVQPALHAFDRAVEIDPKFALAWSERGSLLRELHRLEEAAPCFERAIALGADPELHGYYLASVRGTCAPAAPPRRYVEALFDEYAEDFQSHLVKTLKYQAHESLVRPLLKIGRRYRAVLDLGCGSGLCGPLIRPLAEAVDGVDVSSVMLKRAGQLGVYRDLIHADLVPFLAETSRTVDLVLAADVFIYVGELSAVFRSVRRILEPGGCFAFTVELSLDGQDVRLLPSLRYAHSEHYIRRLAQEYGFKVVDVFLAPLRYDQLKPIQGLYAFLG